MHKVADIKKEVEKVNQVLGRRDYWYSEDYSAHAWVRSDKKVIKVCISWWRDGDVDEPSGHASDILSPEDLKDLQAEAEAFIDMYFFQK